MANTLTFRVKIFSADGSVREERVSTDVPGVVKLGKLESSQVRVDDPEVSRMHAVIEVNAPDAMSVADLGSVKGTWLNGRRINKADLHSGDELKLGSNVRLVIEVEPPEGQDAPSVATGAVEGAAPETAGSAPVMPLPPPPAALVIPPAVAVSAPETAARIAALGDPALDVQDGSRAIEVTALFEDCVVGVRHLDQAAQGKVKPLTWGVFALGVAVVIAGVVLMFSAQEGFGGLLAVLGVGNIIIAYDRFLLERRSPHYVIGEAVEADLHLASPLLRHAHYPLVQSDGKSYALRFTAGMAGDVASRGRVQRLAELSASGAAKATSTPGVFAYPIPDDAQIRVDIGKNTFLISAVPPARRIAVPFFATFKPSTHAATAASFVAHGLVLFLMFAVPPDALSLSTDLFNTDNRLVKALIIPEEEKKEEIPSFLQKKGPDDAGGTGKRHKGDEGKMGKKDAKSKEGLYGLKGPADNADPHLAKRLAEESAAQAGVLGMLGAASGSHLASIFGRDSALGRDAEDALGGLIGNQIGEAYGVGGLGLIGTGHAGGGTGEGTIGLGSLGTIGKGGGGGTGAGYGRGAGTLGGRRASVPEVVAGRAEVRGALDREIIRRVIRRHINEVKHCYQKELQTNTELSGRVVVQFTIMPTGQVASSTVQNTTMNNVAVEQCIAQAVRRWLFPKPKGGGIVIVSYPFVLRAAGEM